MSDHAYHRAPMLAPAIDDAVTQRAGRSPRSLPLPRLSDVAVVGVFAAIFAIALRPVVDNDLFWHLATGRLMWTTHAVPHVDPFSWTVPGRRWIAHEWLTELALYPLYRLGGAALLMLLTATVITAAFVVTYAAARRRGATRPLALGVVVLAALASSHTWGVRPQMLSMLLMAVTALLLTPLPLLSAPGSAEAGRWRRLPWLLPPLLLLWANLHGGFIFGLALIALVASARTLEIVALRRVPRSDAPPPWLLWRTLAFCLLACLCTPNSVAGLLYPFTYLGNNASTRYVAEWASPDFHQGQYLYFEALLLMALVAVALVRRRPTVSEVALIVPFTALALQSVRNISLFSVIVAPLVAVYLSSLWHHWRAHRRGAVTPRPPRPAPSLARGSLNAALIVFIAAAVLGASAPSLADAHNAAIQARRFPAGAVAYLQAHHLSGRLFNSYDWGGYLIWRLYPSQRVYIDGRPDMYGDRFVDAFIQTWQGQSGWAQTLRRQGVRLVMVEPTSGLGRALSTAPQWRLLYRDAVALLYARRLPH